LGLITPEIAAFLGRVRLGFVATVSPAGMPNVSPKGTIVALDGSRLAFADIRSPDTMANIAARPAVEISAIDPLSRRGYLFAGTASARAGGADYEAASRIYSGMGIRSRVRAVAVVDVESVSEVTSPLYDTGASEGEVRASWARRYGVVSPP